MVTDKRGSTVIPAGFQTICPDCNDSLAIDHFRSGECRFDLFFAYFAGEI